MDKLKPCPFCGGTSIRLEKNEYTDSGCDGKIIATATRQRIYCSLCACGTTWWYYEEDAIEAWNQRAEVE